MTKGKTEIKTKTEREENGGGGGQPLHLLVCLLVFGATAPPRQWARAPSFTRFLDHTQRRTTVGRTPLND